MRFLIFLVAFAITMQNTCPHGWAGKAVFISPHASVCQHCPLKEERQPAKSNTQNDVKKDISGINHLFVIHISEPDSAFQILSLLDDALIPKAAHVKDVYLEPPLRPPVHRLSS